MAFGRVRLADGSVFAERFRVGRLLGQGAMGVVYAVVDASNGRSAALKIMNGELSTDAGFAERFAREAAIGRTIGHENVVEVIDSGVDARHRLPWLAMELLEGEELGARLARGPIAPDAARAILEQLFAALAAAHAKNVVHRDLKPENVFLARARDELARVKVLDFGVAKVVREATLGGTAPGLGTPLWAAPEQAKPGAIRPNADVWSLGLLAFQLLAGTPFWLAASRASASSLDLALEILKAPIPRASVRARELGVEARLPSGFDAWFARAVARDPAERFADARVAGDELTQLFAPTSLGRWLGRLFGR